MLDEPSAGPRVKGFVDLQVNGFLGVDFSSPELAVEQVRHVVSELARRGTIAFCPTVCTSSDSSYARSLPVLAQAFEEPDLAPHLLGIHLEGPFISPEEGARGAHPRQHVREPSLELWDRLQDLAGGRVCLLTLAPERPGAEELIRAAREAGVTVALGHHLASREQVARACEAGASASTHLGTGIPNRLPRHPNPIWDQLDEDRLHAMLISDGHHVPDSFLRVVRRVKGLERLVVVSDAAPIAGLAPGPYETLQQEVVLEDSGRLWNPAAGHLVGSSACMLDCVNRLAIACGLGEAELLRVSRDNPLALIGRHLEPAATPLVAEPVFAEGVFRPGAVA